MRYVIGSDNSEFAALGRAVVGFGHFGQRLSRLVAAAVRDTIVFDDTPAIAGDLQQFPFRTYSEHQFADRWFIVGLGYKHLRARSAVIDTLRSKGRRLYSIVHHGAMIDSGSTLGLGAVVNINACLADGAVLHDGVVLEANSTVAHDAVIGQGSFVGPGATLCGNARIGSCVFVGAGAVIRNGVTVGDDSMIGMGAVIARDIGERESWIGNPGRMVRGPLRLT